MTNLRKWYKVGLGNADQYNQSPGTEKETVHSGVYDRGQNGGIAPFMQRGEDRA